jgi:hypothetical protein
MNQAKNSMIEIIKQRGNFTINFEGTTLDIYGSERCVPGAGIKIEEGLVTFNIDGFEQTATLEELPQHYLEFMHNIIQYSVVLVNFPSKS